MASTFEQLILEIITRDRASPALDRIGVSAGDAAGNVDFLQRRLTEVGNKSATARVSLEGDKDAQARLDKLDLKLAQLGNRTAKPDITVEGAARAAVEIGALDVELDHLSEKSASASSGLSLLSNSAGLTTTGMGALIGVGVALSPVIATLGVGLGGLALAALAAGKNSAALKAELAPLKADFAGFGRELQPVVLEDFAKAAGVARGVLHDIEPVAAATGKALGGVLGQVDAEFKSGTWQQFFGFMAQQAGPDMQMLGNLFVSATKALPPLLTALQPLATELLKDATGAATLIGDLGTLTLKIEDLGRSEFHAGQSAQSSGGLLGFLAQHAKQAFGEIVPAVPLLGQLQGELHKMGEQSAAAAAGTKTLVTPAQAAATELQAMATATKNLMTAQQNALNAQVTYGSDLVTSATDAHALELALRKSHDEIGLHTAIQRASFSAANTYITDLGNTAQQAYASGHGVDSSISAIKRGLPILDQAKTKNQQYWQEVKTLVGWLHNLELIKAIHETVFVSGSGTFTVRPGTKLGLPGGTAGGPFGARGAYITQGTTPTADNVIARVSKGELIVPARMVNAGAVDHLRGSIPGFASGGIVGGYSGNVAGLPPWGTHNLNASVAIFEQATATATFAAMKAAQAAAARSMANRQFRGGGGGGSGEAIARAMFPWPASMWPAFNYVEMREAGYQLGARNPSSGAYGVAQFINGPSEYYQYGGNPNTFQGQFTGMFNYIRQRYGNPVAAAAHEQAFNWYDRGGWLYPGATLAVNRTGQPERVTSPAQETATLAALGRIEKLLAAAPERTGGALGDALNGRARSARYSGMYSPRGA